MNLKDLNGKDTEVILKSYDFSHKFYVKYAIICAKYSFHNIKDKNTRILALNAITLAERFSNGEYVERQGLIDAANAAVYAAANAAVYAAANAANAAANAAAYAAAYAANAAANAVGRKISENELRDMLLELIVNEHSVLELILL